MQAAVGISMSQDENLESLGCWVMVMDRKSPPDHEISGAQSAPGQAVENCHRECHQPHRSENLG
jgi:hypothetical protein